MIGARLFFDVYGLKDGAGLTAEFLQPGPASDRIRDGQLDAAFLIAGYPVAAVSELASTAGATILPIDGADREAVLKAIPFWSAQTIPANTYAGQTADIPTVAVGAQLITSADQSEELIYGVTKALWNANTRALLDNGHAKGKAILMANALAGVSLPLHPGAEKFYREAGG